MIIKNPNLANQTTDIFSLPYRVVYMESLMSAVAPRSPAPAKKLSEVDFRSGATLEQLSAQVSELVVLEQGEFGDQTALEVHTAKDFIFNMLGMSAKKCSPFTTK